MTESTFQATHPGSTACWRCAAYEKDHVDADLPCLCNLQKGTEFEGHHHPDCPQWDPHAAGPETEADDAG